MQQFRGLALLGLLLLGGCGGGGGMSAPAGSPTAPGSEGTLAQTVTALVLTWSPSKEVGVNSPGGGYTIYYGPAPKLPIADLRVTHVDVPYVQGAAAPTSTSLELAPGTYYFRITAYASLLAPAGQKSLLSALSAEQSFTVPKS